MADTTSSVKVSLDADLTGGMQTEQQLDKIKKKSRELGSDGAAAGNRMSDAFGKVSRAAGMFQKVLTGMGIAGAFAGAVAAIEKIRESFGGAKKEAEAFAKAKDAAAHKKEIDDLAASYKSLGEAIQASAEATRHANEMLDLNVKNARDLEDAQLTLAEQRELAGVDASDPAAAEKKAAIQARYAARRGETAAQRQKDDIGLAQDKLMREADAKRKDAAAIEASTGADDSVIADVRKRRAAAGHAANSLNGEDATGFWSQFGQNLKRIGTLEWGKVGDLNTEAGDAKRKDAAAEEKALDAELKQLEAQKAEKLKRAEQLRQEAANAEEKANSLGGGIDVANVRAETALLAGRTGQAAADRSLEKKQAQVEKDRATLADAPLLDSYKARMDEEKARELAARSVYTKEQSDVIAAQGRYDMLVANGGSRHDKAAALEALQKEQAEAQDAKHKMEQVAAEVANTLKAITSQINTLSRALNQAKSRLGQDAADAPEG